MIKGYWEKISDSMPFKEDKPSAKETEEPYVELSKEDYIAALEKMKNSPEDRLGTLSEIGITFAGATAGFVVAGAAASAVGATTLLGSATLAGVLGGVFVTSTPVGWLVGGMALAGGATYGLTKLLRSSSKADEEKAKNIRVMEAQLSDSDENVVKQNVEQELIQLIESLQKAVELGYSQEKSNQILVKVFNNKLPIDKARTLLEAYIKSITQATSLPE